MNKSLKQHIDSTRDKITQALLRSAKEYFDLGIELYQKRQKYPYKGFQAILGNLSIAVELLLKCITAKKLFPLLYEGLSKNDLAILIAPENMPAGTLPNAFLGAKNRDSCPY